MTPFIAEIVGTFILILLGNGVVANVVLNGTKGNNSGWIVITTGWALAVYVAVLIAGPVSGAHINPAVTVSLAVAGLFDWALVPTYIAGQMIGAMLGAFCVWLFHKKHYDTTEDAGGIAATFCTAPAIRNTGSNVFSEVIGTFVLLLAVFYIAGPEFTTASGEAATIGLGSLGALPVALVVWSIGLSLGGTTGYAINPARDLGPRIVHALLPLKNKQTDWGYSWIPVIAPILGGGLAAGLYLVFTS
ncbi:aquaporin family protein [Aureisphaera galaxeae]|uniref:MIP/aquaporin family protein n=1 Tax=Aureisphaera galaxeae TaxID=1538023 RepID=UPI00234FD106|nr:MIP/aquaporin family protein [Aureisphaera galaxeae]MDC8002687.1 aquaporin family protein [Aureisphaera galaxeae]